MFNFMRPLSLADKLKLEQTALLYEAKKLDRIIYGAKHRLQVVEIELAACKAGLAELGGTPGLTDGVNHGYNNPIIHPENPNVSPSPS